MYNYRVILADQPCADPNLPDWFVGVIVHADSEVEALDKARSLYPREVWLHAKRPANHTS